MTNKPTAMTGIEIKKTKERLKAVMEAMTQASTSISGPLTTIRRIICNENWTLVMSVVKRVTKLETEKRSMFSKLKR